MHSLTSDAPQPLTYIKLKPNLANESPISMSSHENLVAIKLKETFMRNVFKIPGLYSTFPRYQTICEAGFEFDTIHFKVKS